MKREQPKTPNGGVTKQPCVYVAEVDRKFGKSRKWVRSDFVREAYLSKRAAIDALKEQGLYTEKYRIRKYIRADK